MKSLFFGFFILFASFLANAQTENANQAMQEIFGEEIDLPTKYSFDKKVVMEIAMGNPEGDIKTLTYAMRYREDNSSVGMTPIQGDGEGRSSLGTTIIDFDQLKMITFIETNDTKMATVFSIGEDQLSSESSFAKNKPQFNPTGEEKEILGYNCKEYRVKSKKMTGTVWTSEDLDINLTKSFEALGLQFDIGDRDSEENTGGFIMEFETTDKESGKKIHMQVKDIDLKDRFSLSTKGYIFTSMPVVEEEHRE